MTLTPNLEYIASPFRSKIQRAAKRLEEASHRSTDHRSTDGSSFLTLDFLLPELRQLLFHSQVCEKGLGATASLFEPAVELLLTSRKLALLKQSSFGSAARRM